MKNLLFYRFALFNFLILLGLSWMAVFTPMIEMLVTDSTFIIPLIVLLFLVGFVGVTREIIVATRMRNGSIDLPPTDKEKDLEKIAWLDDVSEWLVNLGLIGTVIGFAIALSGVAENAGNTVEGTRTTVTYLMIGMKIAINTTIVGSIASLWHSINVRMLRTSLVSYWSDRTNNNATG